MKKIIHHIRSQNHEYRTRATIIAAGIATALIAVIWFTTASWAPKPATSNTPSPIQALGGALKSTVSNTSGNQNQVEIIDARDTSILHDETNPYQTNQ